MKLGSTDRLPIAEVTGHNVGRAPLDICHLLVILGE